MKLLINKTELVKSLSQVIAVVEKRNLIEILSHVKMSTVNGSLQLVATDLDIEATTLTECVVKAEGAVTVSADMMLGIAKKMPAGDIELILERGHLTVQSGNSVFKVGTLDADAFPVMASNEYDATFDIEADELRRLFDLTAFAMSTEETRYYLNGVYLHVDDVLLTAVATDGHRLAKATTTATYTMPSVIVPRKTVAELGKVIDDGIVTVDVSETKIRFTSGATVIVSKVIDGTFPDYTRVIPDGNDNIMIVDSAVFAKCSDRVAQVSSDRMRGVKVNVSQGKVVLSVNGDVNSAVDEIEVEYNGEDIERGFNSKYLTEVMTKVDGMASVSFGGAGSPAVIKTDGDDSALFVVMGMRVN